MTILNITTSVWEWVRFDIFGSDILAAIFVIVLLYIGGSSLNIPAPALMGLMIPPVIAIIFLGHLSWFGWLIVIITGLMFGLIIYKVIGVR